MSQFDDLKSRILYEIWLYAQNSSSYTTYTMDVIENKILSRNCLSGMTRAAISSLGEQGFLGHSTETYVEFGGREYTQDEYYITEPGIRSTEYDVAHPGNLVYEIARLAEPTEGLDPGSPGTFVIPAADRVVTLQHNSDPYNEAIAALDDALKEFKEDRLLENQWGPEKGALIRTIEAGRELFEQGEARAATIFAMIVTPLQVVRARYEHAIVAGLVTAGADQLVSSLGQAINLLLRLIGMS